MSAHRLVDEAPAGAFGGAGVLTSTRSDGDFAVTAGPTPGLRGPNADPDRDARRRALIDLPWVEVRQVHGARVVEVGDHPDAVDGTEADALVTARAGVVLGVRTADCAPVFLAGADRGPVGVAHAGWTGIEAGVVEATVAALQALGATGIEARIGPCVEGACYEFGAADLARLADRYGSVVRCVTKWGTAGFSVTAAITEACERVGVAVGGPPPPCTACASDRYWSHRARRDPQRMLSAIWRLP